MNNIKSKIFRYKLPLVKELQLKKDLISFREGLILAYLENDIIIALGEIAPLPEYSKESIDQAENQLLKSVKKMPLDQAIPGLMNEPIIETMIEHAVDAKLLPSVEFGICTAILNVLAYLKKKSVRSLLSEKAPDKLDVNAMISASSPDILEITEKRIEAGYKSIKVKVGRQSLDKDIEAIRDIADKVDSNFSIILDANRAWSVDEALKFSLSLKDIEISYIEEPVKDYLGILQLCNSGKFSIPIALDESLVMISPNIFEHISGITTFVLKPTILGFVKTIGFIKKAQEIGMKAVISSSFESSIGLMFLSELAAGYNLNAGLSTISWFAEDTLESPLSVNSSVIDLNKFQNQRLRSGSGYLRELTLV